MITKLLWNLTLTSRYCWETSADDYQASVELFLLLYILLGKFFRSLPSFCGILPRLLIIVGKLLQMITKLLWNLAKTSRYCWETSADDYQASVESCQEFDILLGNFCR